MAELSCFHQIADIPLSPRRSVSESIQWFAAPENYHQRRPCFVTGSRNGRGRLRLQV